MSINKKALKETLQNSTNLLERIGAFYQLLEIDGNKSFSSAIGEAISGCGDAKTVNEKEVEFFEAFLPNVSLRKIQSFVNKAKRNAGLTVEALIKLITDGLVEQDREIKAHAERIRNTTALIESELARLVELRVGKANPFTVDYLGTIISIIDESAPATGFIHAPNANTVNILDSIAMAINVNNTQLASLLITLATTTGANLELVAQVLYSSLLRVGMKPRNEVDELEVKPYQFTTEENKLAVTFEGGIAYTTDFLEELVREAKLVTDGKGYDLDTTVVMANSNRIEVEPEVEVEF